MNPQREDKRRRYIELIAKKHGGVEGLKEHIAKAPRPPSGLESMETAPDAKASSARNALESIERKREPAHEDMRALEAIIDEDMRPAIDVVDGKFNVTHFAWTKLSTDAVIRKRIEDAIPAIGRIELPGHDRYPYGGTGFIVGDGLVMTNRHVAEIFTLGLGTRLSFRAGVKAGVDFLREQGRPTGPTFEVKRVRMIHPYWDMALLEVDGLAGRTSLTLSLDDARDMDNHEIFIVGYPAFDSRNPTDVQNDLFNSRFGVKRLQPGELQGGKKSASFGKLVPAATHDCSTLGGNSGSAVLDLSNGTVLGLHFGGMYHEQNFAVPASELARDKRVVDAGVKFAGTPKSDKTDWANWWKRADEEAPEAEAQSSAGAAAPAAKRGTTSSASVVATGSDGSVTFEVPLRITVSLGAPGTSATISTSAATESVADSLEGLRIPFHDEDYSTRTGYDPDFLESPKVPMPTARRKADVAATLDGSDILHYQNFSIRMHAKRRLALVTASNVTKEPGLRKPEPGKDYTRKGLAGFTKSDSEKWFPDPRLAAKHQLPDVFFTKDRGSFDKGHIVRRDDVAWGDSYETLRRANGDTYHVTNCSPQVAIFNQSAKADDNWGQLENHVLAEAASERLCVFAGPVLASDDEVFVGVGDGGTQLRAKVPARFWKVIVAKDEDSLSAYGFVLEQDLADVAFEFAVPEIFLPAMYPISEIADMAGVKFDAAVVDADQYETVRGAEIAMRAGAARRRAKR